jgi:gamma-polyglutamate biosynthesis protein CapC
LIGDYSVEWQDGPFKNIQRELTWSGFAELWLNRADRRSLLAQAMDERTEIQPETFVTRIDGYLYDWLMNTKGEIADKGSDLYQPPTEDEMLYFDQEVVTPLLKIMDTEFVDGAFTPVGLSEFHTISLSASIIGYRFIWYRHKLTNQNYLILTERDEDLPRTYRGTFVFRLEKSNPFLVHVTRPLYEQNSFEYGVELFERIQARAIFISGAHRDCNRDGASNIIRLKNKNNFLNLVNQVLLREMKSEPMLVISCRAFGIRQDSPTTESEAIVSFADGAIDQSSFSYLGKMFLDYLKEDQFEYQLVNGSLETAGYEASNLSQAHYLRQTDNKEFVGLWLSPLIRKTYRLKTESILQESHFVSLNIPTTRSVLYDLLDAARQYPGVDQIPLGLIQDVNRYLRTGNIIALQNLLQLHSSAQFKRVFDINSMQTFLIITFESEQKPLVINLNPRTDMIENNYNIEIMNEKNLDKYIASRFAWLDWK